MLEEIGSLSQLQLWRAWYEAEPRGEDRADWHFSELVCELINAVKAFGSGENPISPREVFDHFQGFWKPPVLSGDDKKTRKQAKLEDRRQKLRLKMKRIRAAARAAMETRDDKHGRRNKHR